MYFLVPAFLTATSVLSLVQIETKHAKSMSSPSFTNDNLIEVMRNVSRVNKALQKLIKKDEHLLKVYMTKSFESSDDYSTDSEIDKQYKYENRKKNRAKVNTEKKLITYPVTELAGFDATVESSASNDDSGEETKGEGSASDTTKRNRLPKIENLHAQSSPSKNEMKSASAESSVSGEIAGNQQETIDDQHATNTPEIIFIDRHKILNKISEPAQTSIEPMIHNEHNTTPRQNRLGNVDHRSRLGSDFQNDISLTLNVNVLPKANDSKKVEISPLKSFLKEKIRDWIGINDAYFKTKTKKENKVIGSIPRPEEGIVRNGPKEPPRINRTHTRNQHTKNKDFYFDSAVETKEVDKQMFKTHVLRQAYGDSCTKLVVRKCFKACKMAVKRACVSSRCNESFRSSFKLHSRTGCIRQFFPQQSHENSSELRSRTDGINDDLVEACWPLQVISTKKIPAPPAPTIKTYIEPILVQSESLARAPEEIGMAVLRSRLEKSCDQCSRRRCRKACLFAYEETCSIFHCPSRRRSMLQSRCKRECGREFKTKSSEKTSSGTSSSRDSISVSSDFD